MAGIHEYNDNRYIKEKDEIEKYLMRIIHRYFEIYRQNTVESTEAIIVESITRIKRYLSEEKGFIFHLNGKTGNVVLSIRDIGGEKAFTAIALLFAILKIKNYFLLSVPILRYLFCFTL